MTTFHIGIHRLDWLRAVSILRKLLANDEAKQQRNKSEIVRCLAVAKALLDTVLAVAASVVISLLLMSGDVEEDPGPGGSLASLIHSSSLILLC